MLNLALPHPKQLDLAVPANLRGGRPEDATMPSAPAWGPLVTTYAGILEIKPDWVASHRDEVRILDVRSAAELTGELGHLLGAQNADLARSRLALVARSARQGEVARHRVTPKR